MLFMCMYAVDICGSHTYTHVYLWLVVLLARTIISNFYKCAKISTMSCFCYQSVPLKELDMDYYTNFSAWRHAVIIILLCTTYAYIVFSPTGGLLPVLAF